MKYTATFGLCRTSCLMALFAQVAACAYGASPAAYKPIRLHPENPHYFLWRDKPTILIGATEEFCGLVNAPFDYKTYLDTIAADRSNVVSLMTGILVERGGRSTMSVAEGQLLPPWARSYLVDAKTGHSSSTATRPGLQSSNSTLRASPGVTSTNTWDYYLADRQAKGFHAVIVSALENQFCKEPPKDVLGQLPFNAIPAGTDRFAFRMPDAQDWIVVLRAR